MKPTSGGHLRGLILRYQLIILLKYKVFNEDPSVWDSDQVSLKMFRQQYPRYPRIQVTLFRVYVIVHFFVLR